MNTSLLQSKIYELREQKVMLDLDLAALYQIETKVLNQAVKRNLERFPPDFMFRLSLEEWDAMRSQIVTASQNKRNKGVTPYAFAEQGVAMLSGILKSGIAIEVNIAIMRIFVQLRKLALTYADINAKIKTLEARYDTQFKDVFEALHYLMHTNEEPLQRTQIGYKN